MSTPNPFLNQAEPVTLSQLREALAFVTDQYEELVDGTKGIFVWLWEAIQGDFNQERTTGQIVFDTAISIIPGVDQVCDVRDLIANCKQINEDKTNTWAWVGLVLTLIGLIPSLGSLLKGVLKIFFLFVRRMGGNAVLRAVDEAMTWVITFLRKREVQRYWRGLGWDNVFGELAKQAKVVRSLINTRQLLSAFDRGIRLMNNLIDYVRNIPVIGPKAGGTVDMVMSIRRMADDWVGRVLKPVQDVMDAIIKRLEWEDVVQRRGIVNVGNVHFRGALPKARAVTLMRDTKPPPRWLSEGAPTRNNGLVPEDHMPNVVANANLGYPRLNDPQIKSFAKGMTKADLTGPLRLYRVVGPGSMGASSDWVTEEVWQQIAAASKPKEAWRKHLAVWPDWNPNGQFVVYELKAGETLKVYRGPASAQVRGDVPDHFLEGGWEQIKFDSSQVRSAEGVPVRQAMDSTTYYRIDRATGQLTPTGMNYQEFTAQVQAKKINPDDYEGVRSAINHPAISGPFETGWGYTDFDPQLLDARLGLPTLPGQVTEIKQ